MTIINVNTMIDIIIHKYVDNSGSILTDIITRNWSDAREAVKWMTIVFARFYSIHEENFPKLLKYCEKLESADLQRSKPGMAASIIYWGFCDKGFEPFTQKAIADAFGVSDTTIRNNRDKIREVMSR